MPWNTPESIKYKNFKNLSSELSESPPSSSSSDSSSFCGPSSSANKISISDSAAVSLPSSPSSSVSLKIYCPLIFIIWMFFDRNYGIYIDSIKWITSHCHLHLQDSIIRNYPGVPSSWRWTAGTIQTWKFFVSVRRILTHPIRFGHFRNFWSLAGLFFQSRNISNV